MKVKTLADYNTPLTFIAAGQVVDLDAELAKALIASGIAEEVKPTKKASK